MSSALVSKEALETVLPVSPAPRTWSETGSDRCRLHPFPDKQPENHAFRWRENQCCDDLKNQNYLLAVATGKSQGRY